MFFINPFSVLESCNKVSSEPFLLQAEQPQFSQPFLIGAPALRSSSWPLLDPVLKVSLSSPQNFLQKLVYNPPGFESIPLSVSQEALPLVPSVVPHVQ